MDHSRRNYRSFGRSRLRSGCWTDAVPFNLQAAVVSNNLPVMVKLKSVLEGVVNLSPCESPPERLSSLDLNAVTLNLNPLPYSVAMWEG